jgi:hypothetical protein
MHKSCRDEDKKGRFPLSCFNFYHQDAKNRPALSNTDVVKIDIKRELARQNGSSDYDLLFNPNMIPGEEITKVNEELVAEFDKVQKIHS